MEVDRADGGAADGERNGGVGAIARRASGGTAGAGGGPKLSQFVVCGNLFEVDNRYVPIKPIGKGAYGVVWRAPHVSVSRAPRVFFWAVV